MKKTDKKVNVVRVGVRTIYVDANGQEFVKCFGKWFKFPDQVSY